MLGKLKYLCSRDIYHYVSGAHYTEGVSAKAVGWIPWFFMKKAFEHVFEPRKSTL